MTKMFSLAKRPEFTKRVKQVGLCAIPILIVAAILNVSGNMLLAAVALCALFAFDSDPYAARHARLFGKNRNSEKLSEDKMSLLAAMDAALADPSRKVACVIIEIDDYSKMVQIWGSDVAQAAMPHLASRLASFLREYDEIIHIAPNQFALALCDIRSPELGAVISMIERLQAAVADPLNVDGVSLRLTASAGFTLKSKVKDAAGATMYDAARFAMDDARKFAPDACRAYENAVSTPSLPTEKEQSATLNALKDGQIFPWFQPQISTDTGEITGFEALARWAHPEQGILTPAHFLPTLEAHNQMELLSETILINSLKALKTWDDAGFRIPSVSVNFSTQELRNPSLVERIKWDVDRFEIEPSRLVVEVLETVITPAGDDVIVRNIRALREQGFKIDLDDFGTGHASVANIRKFGVDRIKIDRSFIMRVDEDPDQQRMIAAIVAMVDQLQITALAEGVETIGEQAILSQLGCAHLQGFAIAKPMPLDETLGWISDYQNRLSPSPVLKRRQG